MPEVSVIIVNYRSWRRLGQCLDSLMAIKENQLTFEVIIVDNASNDGVLAEFQTKYTSFHFILNTGNNGFANGCNLGARNTKGDHLLFLNPDTVIGEQAMQGMLTRVRKSRVNSIISCRQVKSDGSEEKPYGKFLSPATLTGWLRALLRITKGSIEVLLENADSYSPDWVSGSVIMISKETYANIKGWDEDFWMYFEDVDLCKRARDAGGDIILLKNVTIEHNHGGSSRLNLQVTALTKTEVCISRHEYIAKHEKGLKGVYMQTFLVINNLVTGFIPAVLGVLLFFNKSLKIASIIYFNLTKYYINALINRTWVSPRSVRYKHK